MTVEHPQARAHHQGIGLAAEIGLLARGHLNGGDKRPAGGGNTVFDGAGHIGIGADELGPGHDQVGGLGKSIQRVGAPLPYHYIVGVYIVHGQPRVIQGIEQARLTDGEHGAARSLFLEKRRRGQGAGVEMLLRHIQSHAGQLLIQLPGRIAAVIGEEEIFLLLLVEPLDKLGHPGQDTVAVIDHTVHITDETLFFVEIYFIGCLKHSANSFLIFRYSIPR